VPVPPGYKVSDEEKLKITEIIKKIFKDDSGRALAIMECETQYNHTKINYEDAKKTGFNSWGLWQLNRPEFVGWDDPEVSTRLAKELFDRRGWAPWYTCSKKLNII
jgi:hypothetical protein